MATTAPKPATKTAAAKGGSNLQAVPPMDEMPEGEAAPQKKSRKKLILITSALMLMLGIGGFVAWYVLDQDKNTPASPDAPAPVKQEISKPPVFVVMEPFTVNLQSEGNNSLEQFLQISFTIQVGDQAQIDLLKLYMPQVRSRLLLLLSSKRASDISTAEGKKKLAEEIMAQVKQPFAPGTPPQSISNVFFTSFVIQ